MDGQKKRWLQVVSSVTLVLTVLFAFTHCVVQSPKTSSRKASSTEESNSSTNTNSNTNTNTNTNNNNTGGNTTTSGEDFFEQTVKTTFEANCMFCHDLPQNNPPVPGPITIYDYDIMKAMMMTGTSGAQNNLMNKVMAQSPHTGGNRCPSGVTDPICDVIMQWYEVENPGSNTGGGNTNPGTPTGDVLDITALGKVTGWGANPNDTNELVTMKFYLDGEQGGAGTFIGSTIAANPGFNGGYAGSHAFQFYVPLSYRDGTTHQLYVYASSNNQDYLVNQTPWTFAAYTTSSAGFNFYQQNLKPLLDAQCASCHGVNYDLHFNNLLEPTPAEGGTATNNQLIRMPAGSFNGLGHPGGNICGSVNGSPCNLIQQWWTIEFGN